MSAYSRFIGLGQIDGRRREAKLLRETRAELTAHCRGRPSATQRALIEQAAQLRLRIVLLDERFAATGVMSDHETRTYLAGANSYTHLLHRLGMIGPRPERQSLAEIIATAPADAAGG